VTLLSVGTMGYSLYEKIKNELTTKKHDVVLKYDNIFKIEPPDRRVYDMMYFLRIKKIKGESIAKSVKGFITIEGTEIQNIPLQWYMQKIPSTNIHEFKDLWLFSTESHNYDHSGLFISHSSDALPDKFFSQWKKDVLHKKIIVRIESENAKVPKEPFTDTVENIISNARDMKS